jgi:hypothetical protein
MFCLVDTSLNIVLVKNLTRPLRPQDMKEYASKYGTVTDIWLDGIKSSALITV